MPRRAIQLARLLDLRRQIQRAALTLESFERWGHGDGYQGMEADIAMCQRRAATRAAIAALSAEMHAEDPPAVAAFAMSRLALLDHCWARSEADSTHRYVIAEEREGWHAWARGAGEPVDENTYYVRFDARQHERLYGFPPMGHGLTEP